tara:strand:+ start:117 stop:359 length:243 start_codon:yes stop_codon:yes gene_type:complete
MDNNNTLKTEAELKNEDLLKNLVLSTCVSCEQQLRLLQLRLISFDDLISGVTETINQASNEIKRLDSIKTAETKKEDGNK